MLDAYTCVLTEADAVLCSDCFDDGAAQFPQDNNPCFWLFKDLEWNGERQCSYCNRKGPEFDDDK